MKATALLQVTDNILTCTDRDPNSEVARDIEQLVAMNKTISISSIYKTVLIWYLHSIQQFHDKGLS